MRALSQPAWPASWTALHWPGNPRVRGLFSSRDGGGSRGPYAAAEGAGGMNLATHVGDDLQQVLRNRERLATWLGGVQAVWLEQVHGIEVADLDAWDGTRALCADAALCSRPGVAAAVLVADCLPVLLAAPQGRAVAAAHAGWRGLAAGVLERSADALAGRAGCHGADLQAWLGPAIGPAHFEVGEEVRAAFVAADALAARAFAPSRRQGHWMADLFELARQRLQRAGLPRASILGGGRCTVADPARHYSFRRDRITGRQAGLVWIEASAS